MGAFIISPLPPVSIPASCQQGPFAPRTLLRFIATTNLAATVSPSVDFPVAPVIPPRFSTDFSMGRGRLLQLLGLAAFSVLLGCGDARLIILFVQVIDRSPTRRSSRIRSVVAEPVLGSRNAKKSPQLAPRGKVGWWRKSTNRQKLHEFVEIIQEIVVVLRRN